MQDIVNYWGFLTACILLNLTPGSDTIYIITRTIAEGKNQVLFHLSGSKLACSFMFLLFHLV